MDTTFNFPYPNCCSMSTRLCLSPFVCLRTLSELWDCGTANQVRDAPSPVSPSSSQSSHHPTSKGSLKNIVHVYMYMNYILVFRRTEDISVLLNTDISSSKTPGEMFCDGVLYIHFVSLKNACPHSDIPMVTLTKNSFQKFSYDLCKD